MSQKAGSGIENLALPEGQAIVHLRWDLCTGCGACEMACSMFHYGVMDRRLACIRIHRYLTPVPKAVQNVCCNCSLPERECQKACPSNPPAVHCDEDRHHMVVDEERCLGSACGRCREACPANVPSFCPPEHDYALVCDLCYREGSRHPQCVDICPAGALEFMKPDFPPHLQRVHPDEKAKRIARRLYRLTRTMAQRPPREVWG